MDKHLQLLAAIYRLAPSPEHSVSVKDLSADLGWPCTQVQDLAEELHRFGYVSDVDAGMGVGVTDVDGLTAAGRHLLSTARRP